MEQSKVVMYARFSPDANQEDVDNVKKEMDLFVSMIDAKLMKQHWEMLPKESESGILDYVIDECMRYGWNIITYDMSTLHGYVSGALSIIHDAAQDHVAIFFIEPKSALKSIMGNEGS